MNYQSSGLKPAVGFRAVRSNHVESKPIKMNLLVASLAKNKENWIYLSSMLLVEISRQAV